jgi:hypothetical protein
MATRTVTTSRSNLSNNALITAGYLLNAINVGSRIRGNDIRVLNQLMADLCGHTHTWQDLSHIHIGGNLDPGGWGSGEYASRRTDPAVPGVGFPPSTTAGGRINSDDVNFGIRLHNQVAVHSHQTVDQEE